MRAAILHTPGRPPTYGEHPAPVAAAGTTVVRVSAAPIVPLDLLCASGESYFGVPATPYVPGGQGVGVVESSDSLEVGSRVWFFATAGMRPGDGSMAERCAVPDSDVVPLEVGVPDELAAAVGLSGVAAWMALSWRARLQPGERVLVLGGSGAVGQVGIGAAHVLGAASVSRSHARRRSSARGPRAPTWSSRSRARSTW
jgi:NADPH:quinone reductase-like Zn-dependent oxidoreductase